MTPETNSQAGIPLTDPETESPDLIATGDRRGEMHYEADPDQLVRVRSLSKPQGPIPPDMTSEGRAFEAGVGEPVEDIQVPVASPSVWDARPPDDDAHTGSGPTGY